MKERYLDYIAVHGKGKGIIKVLCYKKPVIANDTIEVRLNDTPNTSYVQFYLNPYEALLLSRLLIWAVQRRQGFTYSKM